MGFVKRIFLFLAVNILVVMTISFLLSLFNVQPYLQANGLDYESLAVFCLVWGFGGAFISLALSRQMAKWMMGVKLIENDADEGAQQIKHMVHQLARSAGITTMPQVGIYSSEEPNAFATGPTKNRALVAVSSGLVNRMSHEELEGVLGHEISHIANGDMVTMTLLQGLVNAFVMFLARVIAFVITTAGRRSDDDRAQVGGFAYYLVVMVLEMVLMLFGSIVVAWFSRHREFRADAGGARLAGRDKMVNALRALQRTLNIEDPSSKQTPALQTLQISSRSGTFLRLFSSHPPLEERIAALETMAY